MSDRRFPGIVFLCALGAGGCVSSMPVNLYILQARMPFDDGAATTGPVVALDPVELPAYLDRPQIVTRVSPHRVRAAEFERWAEPLDDGVTRVLAENIGRFLPSDRVAVGSWQQGSGYRVTVQIGRFEGDLGGAVVLIANWTLVAPGGRTIRAGARTVVEQPTATPTYEATADAMSGALSRLGEQIAAAIREAEFGG